MSEEPEQEPTKILLTSEFRRIEFRASSLIANKKKLSDFGQGAREAFASAVDWVEDSFKDHIVTNVGAEEDPSPDQEILSFYMFVKKGHEKAILSRLHHVGRRRAVIFGAFDHGPSR